MYEDAKATGTASLPLMGIGNSHLGEPSPQWVELITPHGDRELAAAPAASDAHLLSLPLMGIGNLLGFLEAVKGADLITPHGDREPARSTSAPPEWTTHYPSWGSGTLPASHCDSADELSLPLMGIGNRLPRRAWKLRAASHYPSWGSGTPDQGGEHGQAVTSLPLMGIGNLRLELIPLMLGNVLITPHGDREPDVPRRKPRC